MTLYKVPRGNALEHVDRHFETLKGRRTARELSDLSHHGLPSVVSCEEREISGTL